MSDARQEEIDSSPRETEGDSADIQPVALTPFLNKLHEILSKGEAADSIRWGQGGATIVVTDRVKLARQVLPRYFKHDNIRSFIRQLNIYGFQRCRSQTGAGVEPSDDLEFWHDCFIEGRTDLMRLISRSSASHKRACPPSSASPLRDPNTSIQNDTASLVQEIFNVRSSILDLDQQLLIQSASVRCKIGALADAISQVSQEVHLPPPQHELQYPVMQPASGDQTSTRSRPPQPSSPRDEC